MATKAARKLTERQAKWQGGKWIVPARRIGIYLRDGLACVWCGQGIEDGIRFSLDHLIPDSRGGDNKSSNLCTSCSTCNSSRGNRSVAEFAVAVAGYLNHGADPKVIEAHVWECASRPVPLAEAKELLARRGGITAALAAR